MGYVHVPAAPTQLPANVTFDSVSRIVLEGNHFTRLGAGGLAIDGSTAVEVRGNVFDEISGSGIAVQGSARVTVEDNLVHHIGTEYRGSPAIWSSSPKRPPCRTTRSTTSRTTAS